MLGQGLGTGLGSGLGVEHGDPERSSWMCWGPVPSFPSPASFQNGLKYRESHKAIREKETHKFCHRLTCSDNITVLGTELSE